jgi:23S rRNA pseudouridine2605 synthase
MKRPPAPGSRSTRGGKNEISLCRALSKMGAASRAQARVRIEAGEVTVNGRVTRDPDLWVDPRRDKIALAGSPVRAREFVYLALHKPAGVVTTRSDEKGRTTVYSLLPPETPWVFPVGRLDKESSGLLILTNNTAFGERLTAPASKLPKVYEVRLDRPLQESDGAILRKGMTASGEKYLPVGVERTLGDPRMLLLTLTEGKNRQIRKMLAALGYDVTSLHRRSIGRLALGALPAGDFRSLTQAEVEEFS